MTVKTPILVLACLFVVLPNVLATCPSREDMSSCSCREDTRGDLIIVCAKIDDKKLIKLTSSLRGMTVDVITIKDSEFGFIRDDVFKGVKVKKFNIEESTLSALTDRGEAFVGLEDHLEELRIWYCDYKDEWDWSVLRNLKKLKRLTIAKSVHLETLGTDVMKDSIPSSMEYLFFTRNNISYVTDHAFDSFKDMTNFTLINNKIRNLKRTMLPNPALDLYSFAVGFNLIEQIPKDMFTKMPNLQFLDISFNKILTLNEVTFSPVWEKLEKVFISGNPLRCDCGMSWLLEKRTPYYLSGECASPPELKGWKLTTLTSKDFVCYV